MILYAVYESISLRALGQCRKTMTTADFLHALHLRGATRIRRVSFRNNRSTVWSLTQRGTVLNVHAAYGEADAALLDAFATVVREGGTGSREAKAASKMIVEWPTLIRALAKARADAASDATKAGTRCCGTDGQRTYLRAAYTYFNTTRFDNILPADVPIRLSERMSSRLGHMLPSESEDGQRRVDEIALNVDLMLPGNGAERIDTLLHEMAHAADWLTGGAGGHGPSWREWARRAGCLPNRMYHEPVHARRPDAPPTRRAPPLPPALGELSKAS